MNEDLVIDQNEIGVQNDGEPAVVAPPVVEPEPEPEAPEPEAAELDEPEGEQDEPEHPKKKSGSQRWKEKAQREAEEKEYWRQQALSGQKAPQEPAPQPEGKPKQEDFETHAEWVEAVTDWKVDQKLAQRQVQSSWEAKEAAAKAKYEDFDDALAAAPMPKPHIVQLMHKSPLTADIAYHLATHSADFRRINSLDPASAALELGEIVARIKAGNKPEAPQAPKPATKAPRPPSPVSAPSAAKPSDDGRFEVY